jgi:hypothetical protein
VGQVLKWTVFTEGPGFAELFAEPDKQCMVFVEEF